MTPPLSPFISRSLASHKALQVDDGVHASLTLPRQVAARPKWARGYTNVP